MTPKVTPKIRRTDANQAEIVAALEKAGCSVLDTHTLSGGAWDIEVGYAGHNYPMEIKMPGGKLTPTEVAFHQSWHGTIYVVYSAEDALRVVGLVR